MHSQTLIGIQGGLESTTNFTDLHVLVLLYNCIVN